jgi:hypothetical protein
MAATAAHGGGGDREKIFEVKVKEKEAKVEVENTRIIIAYSRKIKALRVSKGHFEVHHSRNSLLPAATSLALLLPTYSNHFGYWLLQSPKLYNYGANLGDEEKWNH